MSKDREPKHALGFEQLEPRFLLSTTPLGPANTPSVFSGSSDRLPALLNSAWASFAPANSNVQILDNAAFPARSLSGFNTSERLASFASSPSVASDTDFRRAGDAPLSVLGTRATDPSGLPPLRDNGLLAQLVSDAAYLADQTMGSARINVPGGLLAAPRTSGISFTLAVAESVPPVLTPTTVGSFENSTTANTFLLRPFSGMEGSSVATPGLERSSTLASISLHQRIDNFFGQMLKPVPRPLGPGDSVLSVSSAFSVAIPPFRPDSGSFNLGMILAGELKVRFANLSLLNDFLSVVMPPEASAFASILSSSLANRPENPINTTTGDSTGQTRANGYGRDDIEAWPTTAHNSYSVLLRNVDYRIACSSSSGQNAEHSRQKGRAESPPASPGLEEFLPLDPVQPFTDSESARPDRIAARLVGFLGRGATLSPRVVEVALRKFIEDIHAAEQTVTDDAFESGLVPWIIAIALAALACESGRRQMQRYKLRAEHDDACNQLRDLLFLNLGHDHD